MGDAPNPGSPEATERGCVCPVLDNARGRGAGLLDGRPVFIMDIGCPLHGEPELVTKEAARE